MPSAAAKAKEKAKAKDKAAAKSKGAASAPKAGADVPEVLVRALLCCGLSYLQPSPQGSELCSMSLGRQEVWSMSAGGRVLSGTCALARLRARRSWWNPPVPP
mmetsp:Transcript_585/g.1582  ORF Transcript_585/g.1582 Transcript_585/m.1582 type:complete len:103 (+) Transcript_585:122-430(+)